MTPYSTAPIALFSYNRPDHLKVTLEALSRCDGFEECPLYVFCDAPRHPREEVRVQANREVARKWVAEHGGTLIERDRNLGFGNLTLGVTDLCEKYGRVIVVEDDIVAAPDFLNFMRSGLDRYQNDPQVYLINAFMYADAHPELPPTFFLPTAFPWGWATWQRAWQHFEWRPKGYQEFLANKKERKRFDFDGKWRISRWLESAMAGKLDCWDPQWAYKVFTLGGVGLFPCRSLIWNSGVGCGMHGGSDEPMFEGRDFSVHGALTLEDFSEPRFPHGWNFPAEPKTDEKAYQRMVRFFQKERRRERLNSRGPWYMRYYKSLLKKLKT